MDLALNNLQRLIYHKTQTTKTNQTKLNLHFPDHQNWNLTFRCSSVLYPGPTIFFLAGGYYFSARDADTISSYYSDVSQDVKTYSY